MLSPRARGQCPRQALLGLSGPPGIQKESLEQSPWLQTHREGSGPSISRQELQVSVLEEAFALEMHPRNHFPQKMGTCPECRI